mmetsp:Transcript_16384/g.43381  ORF Transcript_16384/g.43381 Transcript_16384/m.43381 type:complete len:257 (-) Transcript_16384:12-782(-)
MASCLSGSRSANSAFPWPASCGIHFSGCPQTCFSTSALWSWTMSTGGSKNCHTPPASRNAPLCLPRRHGIVQMAQKNSSSPPTLRRLTTARTPAALALRVSTARRRRCPPLPLASPWNSCRSLSSLWPSTQGDSKFTLAMVSRSLGRQLPSEVMNVAIVSVSSRSKTMSFTGAERSSCVDTRSAHLSRYCEAALVRCRLLPCLRQPVPRPLPRVAAPPGAALPGGGGFSPPHIRWPMGHASAGRAKLRPEVALPAS